MTITDFHTHRADAGSHAIVSVAPEVFRPLPAHHYSVGIHPWQSGEATDDTLALLDRIAAHPQVVAIGETGLDTLRGAPLPRQEELLRHHLALADAIGKPLVLHCVRAAQQLVAAWRATTPHRVEAVVHGFRGNPNVARVLLEAGFHLCFGPRFNAAAVALTPANQLLIETDDTPTDIDTVAAAVGAVRGISADDVLRLATDNAARLLH